MGIQKPMIYSATMAAMLAATGAAHAYEAGDIIVRGGTATVAPTSSHSPVAGGAFNLRADTETQLGLSVTYMLSNAVGLNVLAATPFSHEIEAKEANNASIGSTKHLPPTVTLSYYPLADSGSAFKPYVGAGLNYTFFWDEKLNDTGKAATGAENLSLGASFGLAAQLGLDYALNDTWAVGAALYYVDIDTKAKLDGANIGTVEIDPMVYRFHVAYRFR